MKKLLSILMLSVSIAQAQQCITIYQGGSGNCNTVDTDSQSLSVNGNQLTITRGNTVTLPSGGSVTHAIRNISTSTTLTEEDYTVIFDGSNTGQTITLPLANSCLGRQYQIVNLTIPLTLANTGIDIIVSGSDAIISPYDPIPAFTVYTIGDGANPVSVILQSDGLNWIIII